MRYELQTTGSLEIILLEIPFHRLIHAVPAQYTLIYQSIVGFYVDPIWLGQPNPFAFDQPEFFQLIEELQCFLLAAARRSHIPAVRSGGDLRHPRGRDRWQALPPPGPLP